MLSTYMAVYGTLRVGEPFYEGLKDPKYIETITLKGYDMYSLGAFPMVTEAPIEHTIVADVLELQPPDASYISRIERGAGYKLKIVGRYDGNPVYLWVARRPEILKDRPLIGSGDWTKRSSKDEGF